MLSHRKAYSGWFLVAFCGTLSPSTPAKASENTRQLPEGVKRNAMQDGAKQVSMGKELLLASTRHIQSGTALTRQANQLRSIARRVPQEGPRLSKMVEELSRQGAQLKTYGAELRQRGTVLQGMGLSTMRRGYADLRGFDAKAVRPISLMAQTSEGSPKLGRAHNAAFRSTKPSLQGINLTDSKSLAVGLSGQAQNIPEGLDLHPMQLSADGRYFAYVESANGSVRLNEIHEWHLWLTDLEGRPVPGATIEVQGDMPGHVHGMPTRPRVVAKRADGRYVIQGMKFQMSGWWVMTFSAKSEAQGEDRIIYNILL